MFSISFLATEFAFTAIWLLVRISIWIRKRSVDWKRETVLILNTLGVTIGYGIYAVFKRLCR